MSKRDNKEDKKFRQVGEELIKRIKKSESFNHNEIDCSWREIEEKSSNVFYLKRRLWYVASIAASLLMLISVGFIFYYNQTKADSLSVCLLKEISYAPTTEIYLKSENSFLKIQNLSTICFDSDGVLISDKDFSINEKTNHVCKISENEIYQIVVPKGKKLDIVFSDGTKMKVNSNSRIIFPSIFKKEKREILVEGEAFLEVTKDIARPFIVKTSGFNIKVLGTKFNVRAYKESPSATVVLVKGSVEVITNKRKERAVLSPSHLLEVGKDSTMLKEVDVYEYICWKDNIMMLDKRQLGEVLNELANNYNRKIIFDDAIKNIPLSGKIDLKENVEDAVEIVCLSLSLKYKIDNNKNIIITTK